MISGYGVVDIALGVVGIPWGSYSVVIHIELLRECGNSCHSPLPLFIYLQCDVLCCAVLYTCTVCENMSKPVPTFRPAIDHEA